MANELEKLAHSVLGRDLLIACGVFSILALLATFLLTPLILTRLPADYLTREEARSRLPPVLFVLKNALGILVVLVGVLMLVLPGQGILTIVLGLGLVDFPGRAKLERRILGQPRVLKTVNALRRRASRPPLEI